MPNSGTVMPFLSEAAESLEAAGSAGRSELGRGRHAAPSPFSCLIFDPVSATGNRRFSMGGACLRTGRKRLANDRREGYFLDLAHKIATRGRQAAHRGVPFRITSPELAALFLLPVRKTAINLPIPQCFFKNQLSCCYRNRRFALGTVDRSRNIFQTISPPLRISLLFYADRSIVKIKFQESGDPVIMLHSAHKTEKVRSSMG